MSPAELRAWSLDLVVTRPRLKTKTIDGEHPARFGSFYARLGIGRRRQPVPVLAVEASTPISLLTEDISNQAESIPSPPITELFPVECFPVTVMNGVPDHDSGESVPAALDERRRHARVQVDGRAQIRCGKKTISAELLNVSKGGVHCVVPDARAILKLAKRRDSPLTLERDDPKVQVRLKWRARSPGTPPARSAPISVLHSPIPTTSTTPRSNTSRPPTELADPDPEGAQTMTSISPNSKFNETPARPASFHSRRGDYRLRGLDLRVEDPEEAPRRPSWKDEPRRNRRRRLILKCGIVLITAAAITLLLRATIIQPFFVPTSAMSPTLKAGDRILVTKSTLLTGSIGQGSIVVFQRPKHFPCSTDTQSATDLVQRVIATPGETIWSSGNTIYVDGRH